MDMTRTPRKTKLFNELCKDYQPKDAAKRICQYIEELEARFEERIRELEVNQNSLQLRTRGLQKKTEPEKTEPEKTEPEKTEPEKTEPEKEE